MKKKIVKAIVFADRRGEELLPLTETMCVALLPVVAKPLIEHTLDALSIAHIRQAIVIISAMDEPQIKAVLGDGERLGIEINYVLSQGEENPTTLLTNLYQQLDETEYLLIRGDLLHSLKINDFLKQSEQISTETHPIALIDGYFSGMCLWRKSAFPDAWQESEILHWATLRQNYSHPETFSPSFHPVAMSGYLSLLDSLLNYYQANFAVLANRFPALTLPGYSMKEQLLVGHRSGKVSPQTTGIIGHHCHIAPQACLNNVILGDRVIVDQHAELNNVIVFSDTYIGKSIKLHNTIVWGNCCIQLESETMTFQVIYDLSLADLKKQSLKAIIIKNINRLIAWVSVKK